MGCTLKGKNLLPFGICSCFRLYSFAEGLSVQANKSKVKTIVSLVETTGNQLSVSRKELNLHLWTSVLTVIHAANIVLNSSEIVSDVKKIAFSDD